jgi:hypothetical protein
MNRHSMLRGNGFAVSRDLNPVLVPVERLKPLGRETRKHPPAQIRKLESSIEEFGFVLPLVIDADNRVIAGWGLAVAAKKLGLAEVPARRSRRPRRRWRSREISGCSASIASFAQMP